MAISVGDYGRFYPDGESVVNDTPIPAFILYKNGIETAIQVFDYLTGKGVVYGPWPGTIDPKPIIFSNDTPAPGYIVSTPQNLTAEQSAASLAAAQAAADSRDTVMPLTPLIGTGYFYEATGDTHPGSYRCTQSKTGYVSANVDRVPLQVGVTLTDVVGAFTTVNVYLKDRTNDNILVGSATSNGTGNRQTLIINLSLVGPPTIPDLIPAECVVEYTSGAVPSTEYYLHFVRVIY